jgi:hypothetical protein
MLRLSHTRALGCTALAFAMTASAVDVASATESVDANRAPQLPYAMTLTATLHRPSGAPVHDAKSGAILYVLVNNGLHHQSYIALFHAYAKTPKPFARISRGIRNPTSIWVDPSGNLYVGNSLTYHSSVVMYAPGSLAPTRTYTTNVDLPFGGTLDAPGNMYVSDAGIPNSIEGGVAVYLPGASAPDHYLNQNVHVPHGVAVDASGNVFLADIWGVTYTAVVEFIGGSRTGTILPLDNLGGSFLEDLKLDAAGDIVVADATRNAVRFYPPPYAHQSRVLTAGLSAPTGLAYGPDGSLFVANEYVNVNTGNVVVFAPGSNVPTRTIATGIMGGVLGVAVSP